MRNYAILLFPLLFILMQSCERNPLEVNTSEISVDLSTNRLDRDFFQFNTSDPEAAHQMLYQKYGTFYYLYLEEILRTGPGEDYRSLALSIDFINDPYMAEAYNAIQHLYTDETIAESDEILTEAFRHYRYHFPDALVPEIVYYHSGFNFGIYSTDSVIGVGLEWFLGRANEITIQLPFPEYRKSKMDPAYLEANIIKDWCNRYLYQDMSDADLLDNLIYYGKIMYMVEAMLPSMADSTLMNWPAGAIEWCHKNEFSIWKELANEKQTLFESNQFEIQKWLIDGPFTSGLPQDSPAMAGIWIGWEMTRSYHAKFPDKSLNEVLIKDSKEIMKYYNPKK